MKQPDAKPAPVTAPKPGPQPKPEAPKVTTPPPSSNIPKSKEQRLKDLLDLYKADKISPKEYHEQRQKILTEK